MSGLKPVTPCPGKEALKMSLPGLCDLSLFPALGTGTKIPVTFQRENLWTTPLLSYVVPRPFLRICPALFGGGWILSSLNLLPSKFIVSAILENNCPVCPYAIYFLLTWKTSLFGSILIRRTWWNSGNSVHSEERGKCSQDLENTISQYRYILN